MNQVLQERRPLSVSVLGHREQIRIVVDLNQPHDLVVLLEIDALHPGRNPTHDPGVVLVEADGHPGGGREQHVVVAGGVDDVDQPIALVQVDGDDSRLVDVAVVLQRRALDLPTGGREDQVIFGLLEVLDVLERDHALFRAKLQDVLDRATLRDTGHLGDLVDLQLEDAARVGEDRAGRRAWRRRTGAR